MTSRPQYESGIQDLKVPARSIGRRTMLLAAVGGLGAVVGVAADRAFGGVLPAGSALNPAASPSRADVVRPLAGNFMNLRALKPYDWMTKPTVGLGGPARLEQAASNAPDYVWWAQFEAGEHPSIAAERVEVIAVAAPADEAPFVVVELSLVGRPVQAFERLRDVGNPADIEQLRQANGVAPHVGDLWIFVPRDGPWVPGDYRVVARLSATAATFDFTLT